MSGDAPAWVSVVMTQACAPLRLGWAVGFQKPTFNSFEVPTVGILKPEVSF
ncbi:hypothetical protein ALQ38_02585 [Pseudomonas marginalis pv. marginalis]|nr:hypothetical protein ALQ38_02585 [Pseudomonas marginalis pv. marginalis]SET47951.1 hypothetical protein SAMN03159512_02522 [Pseudomonas sp. NFR09]